MKAWIHYHRKLLVTIAFLVLTILVLLRVFVFFETDARGERDNTALIRSFFDSLMAMILVTVSVTLALAWMRSPIDKKVSENFIQPFEIDDKLREGAKETREWYYLGHTGRYIRSQILPFISRDSQARNENKRIKVIILDPNTPAVCEFYAGYRNNSRSISITKDTWTEERVCADLLATILCLIELQQANSMLEVNAGLIQYVSLFRSDISSTMVLITQEDNQEPAIWYSQDSHFNRCYRREFELVWSQSKQLRIADGKSKLILDDLVSVRKSLLEVGLDATIHDDRILKKAVEQAKQKESPYVNR